MPINLRQLRYFLAVAGEGNLTRAAAALNLQQPPLTRHIHDLEATLGVALFTRLPRGMRLTAAGEAVAEEARRLLERLGELPALAQLAAAGEVGGIRIGYTSSAAFNPLVLDEIRAFSQSTPRVQIRLEEASTAELVAELTEGRLHAAFLRAPPSDIIGLTVDPILNEDMVLAIPAGHRLAAARTPVQLRELAEETFVLYRRANGPGLYDLIISACRAAGFNPRVGQEAPRMPSTLSLVAAGLGLSFVPETMARMNVSGVVLRPLVAPSRLRAPLLLATAPNPPPVAERFRLAVQEATERKRASSAP